MNLIDKIRVDINNPNCLGFFFESDGNSVSVSKNGDKLNATYESWNGNRNVVQDEDLRNIEAHIAMLHEIDPYGTYCPSFKPTKWSNYEIDAFMNKLSLDLCNPDFEGFDLRANGTSPVIVRRNHGGFHTWKVNIRGCEMNNVLDYVHERLGEDIYWEYVSA